MDKHNYYVKLFSSSFFCPWIRGIVFSFCVYVCLQTSILIVTFDLLSGTVFIFGIHILLIKHLHNVTLTHVTLNVPLPVSLVFHKQFLFCYEN